MHERKTMTMAEWRAEGVRRFGDDLKAWRFVCPACGHVACAQDWIDAGAPDGAVGYSCVGRWLRGPVRDAFEARKGEPGPCNYAGGGLFGLNPISVMNGEDECRLFAFEPTAEELTTAQAQAVEASTEKPKRVRNKRSKKAQTQEPT